MGKPEAWVVSNWSRFEPQFSTSAQEFYAVVEEALKPHEIPDLQISRMVWHERGIASAGREYLRVRRGRFVFDICAAPFGKGYFFSWWLSRIPVPGALLWTILLPIVLVGLLYLGGLMTAHGNSPFVSFPVVFVGTFLLVGLSARNEVFGPEEAILDIPYVGRVYDFFWGPITFYRQDTAAMFQAVVRGVVNHVIEEVRSEKGLRALSRNDLQPRLRDLGR